jgi:hypothetical protein
MAFLTNLIFDLYRWDLLPQLQNAPHECILASVKSCLDILGFYDVLSYDFSTVA